MNVFKILGEKLSLEGDRAIRFFGGFKTQMLRWRVRHRSHATPSRQPRQVRKEATVTGSCVCSGLPVPG